MDHRDRVRRTEARVAPILPWRWTSCLPTSVVSTPSAPPVVEEKLYRLVDWVAEDVGISRGKARRAIVDGKVSVDGEVETDPDRMLPGTCEVVLCST